MARIVAVSLSPRHRFSKLCQFEIELVAGFGVRGDSHAGETVQHLSRLKRDASQPNLRQVHLMPAELLAELAGKGFAAGPGELGENVTTQGLDLIALPRGTLLTLGESAVVEVTGLRNPCVQIERFQPGLLDAVLGRTPDGGLIRKTGVMSIVRHGGLVRPGDQIAVTLPEGAHQPLEVV